MTYAEKLKDPKWQKCRLRILERDDFTCTSCGDTETTLHVHHIKYLKGKQPWEYDDQLLTTYCEHCHSSYELYKSKYGTPEYFRTRKFRFTTGYVLVATLTETGLTFSSSVSSFDTRALLDLYVIIEDFFKRN